MQHISPTRTVVYTVTCGALLYPVGALTGAVFMNQFLPGQDTLGCLSYHQALVYALEA